ncbi:MAG: VWA domain-containing protein [Candidatus Helarchaeota archaeon]
MEKILIQFIAVLREAGIPITTSEELDCANSLSQNPRWFDYKFFYYMLRSTLVKSQQYYPIFEEYFHQFFFHRIIAEIEGISSIASTFKPRRYQPSKQTNNFPKIVHQNQLRYRQSGHRQAGFPAPLTKQGLQARPRQAGVSSQLTKQGLQARPRQAGVSSPLIQQNLQAGHKQAGVSDPHRQKLSQVINSLKIQDKLIETILKKLFLGDKSEVKQYASRLADKFHQMKRTFGNAGDEPQDAPFKPQAGKLAPLRMKEKLIDWHTIQVKGSQVLLKFAASLEKKALLTQLTAHFIDQLSTFKRIFHFKFFYKQHQKDREHSYNQKESRLYGTPANLKYLYFDNYQDIDQHEFCQIVKRLAHQLASKASLRYKRNLFGKLDMKKTLHLNLKYDGHPVTLHFKKRRISKPVIMILCDVSGSVNYAVGFFLYFLMHFMKNFSRIRAFLFVSHLCEVDVSQFKKDSFNFQSVLYESDVDLMGYSDFGKAFSIFHERYRRELTSRTILLILGDARNNYKLPNDHLLQKWRKIVRKLIWLNPEPRERWNTADSIIDIYAEYCDVVAECGNLAQLAAIVDKYIL